MGEVGDGNGKQQLPAANCWQHKRLGGGGWQQVTVHGTVGAPDPTQPA